MKDCFKKIVFILAAGVLFNSCKTDFDLIAPYKESVAVYGLLSQSDSVNYIRVNRVFLGEGDATLIAQNSDSVYFKPGEVSVSVEKYYGSVKKQTYNFTETYEKPLSPGYFNVNQLIYKSIQPFSSDSAGKVFEYQLIVRNNLTGMVYTAKTTLVRDYGSSTCSNITPVSYCVLGSFFIPGLAGAAGNVNVKLQTTANARIVNLGVRFYYRDSLFSGAVTPHFVDIKFPNKKASTLAGGEVMDFSFSRETFYNTVGNGIVDDPSIVRSRTADSLVFFVVSGGEELSLYNEINGTTGSFGQEKPIYTNIDGGVGVFSARYTKKAKKAYYNCHLGAAQTGVITYGSLDQLAIMPATCHLRFTKSDCSINTFCP
jgi:hypothetical protein